MYNLKHIFLSIKHSTNRLKSFDYIFISLLKFNLIFIFLAYISHLKNVYSGKPSIIALYYQVTVQTTIMQFCFTLNANATTNIPTHQPLNLLDFLRSFTKKNPRGKK